MALVGDGQLEVSLRVGIEAAARYIKRHQIEIAVRLEVESLLRMKLHRVVGGVVITCCGETFVEEVVDVAGVAAEGDAAAGVVELTRVVASQVIPLGEDFFLET